MAIVPEQAKPEVGPPNKRAGYLLAGLSAFTLLFTALGISKDEIPDVWRNHEVLSYVAITLILCGVGLGAVAGWVLQAGDRRERKTLLWGNASLGLGLIVAAWAGIATASDRPKPTITASVVQDAGKTSLNVLVENRNLKVDQALNVMIEPLVETKDDDGRLHYRVRRPLYSATLGPNGDGTVKRSILTEVPPGTFDDIGVRASVDPSVECYDERSATGCVVVRIPQRSEQPQLTYGWKRGRRNGRSLRVHVTAFDIPNKALQFVALALPSKRVLARAQIPPSLNGDVDHRFGLPVGRARAVCVAASTGTDWLSCPPEDRSEPGWIWLRSPRRR